MKLKMLLAAAAASLLSTGAQAAVSYDLSRIGSAPGDGTTITFDQALPDGFRRTGGMVQSENNGFGINPTGSSNYLTTNLASGAGSASIFSKAGFQNIAFDWGTVDTYNTFALLDAAGNAFYTLTGQQIMPNDGSTGTRISLASTDQAIYGLRLYSGQPAFEVDNVTFSGAVPEPATWAMMILGFGLVGASMRRRSSVRTGSVAAA
jgi:hypothetical protein